jgi:hypothetical protein
LRGPSRRCPTLTARGPGGTAGGYGRLRAYATTTVRTTATTPTTIKLATHVDTPITAAMSAARPAATRECSVARTTARVARRAGRGTRRRLTRREAIGRRLHAGDRGGAAGVGAICLVARVRPARLVANASRGRVAVSRTKAQRTSFGVETAAVKLEIARRNVTSPPLRLRGRQRSDRSNVARSITAGHRRTAFSTPACWRAPRATAHPASAASCLSAARPSRANQS